jgi:hypothetical protein
MSMSKMIVGARYFIKLVGLVIVGLLLSVFARTDITDGDGVTPTEKARQRGYMNIAYV